MKTSYKFIEFVKNDYDVWYFRDKKNGYKLGEISYKCNQPVIDFEKGCVYNRDCLKDIIHFLNQFIKEVEEREFVAQDEHDRKWGKVLP